MFCNLKNRNYNLIGTTELPGIADDWLADYPELTDPKSDRYSEEFLQGIRGYDRTIAGAIAVIDSENYISLEDRRNQLLEKVIDALDDHLCFKVPDWDDDCTRFGIEHSEVIKRNSVGYAAMKLLRKDEDKFWPSYGSEHSVTGHLWEEEDFSRLIAKLAQPEYSPEIELTGIRESAADLVELERELNLYIEEHKIRETVETLREKRYVLLRNLSMLPHLAGWELYDEEGERRFFASKKRRYCHPAEFIPEYYIRDREQKEMLMFSWNDFDTDQFFEFAKKSVEKVFSDDSMGSWEIGEIKGEWYDFRTLYDACVKSPEWEEFCEIDKEWWQLSEKLLLTVAHERYPFGADYERQMELHRSSGKAAAYENLSSVLSENYFAFFRRGESFYEQNIMTVLEKWDSPDQRKHLALFDAEELFDSLKVVNERCESLFQKIEPVLEGKDLGDLRHLRRNLTTIFNNTL